jgi:hypothetical protein
MKSIFVHRFDGGMADSPYSRGEGQFSVAKHFDTLTYPHRLRPYRGTQTDLLTQTGIGNFLIGQDSYYGLGVSPASPTVTNVVYKKSTSLTDAWERVSLSATDIIAVSAPRYELFLEYRRYSGGVQRKIFIAGTNNIHLIDPAGILAVVDHALTFTNIAQGVVHAKDDRLYIPYDNKIAVFDSPPSGSGDTWTDAALTLPATERITSITPYGNYLAIATVPERALAGVANTNSAYTSKVYLWDRDISLATVSEVIDWGTGLLRVLNTLDGVLIGLSDTSGTSPSIFDIDSIQIKGYQGAQPFLIKEITTTKQTTTAPDALINPRVNFINRNRLYFSLNIVGGGSSPAYYGLWSLGKSKVTGTYGVTIEYGATNDHSDTGVLAALIVGDLVQFAHTAAGTLTRSISSTSLSTAYAATSFYESLINPRMPDGDYYAKKQLLAVSCHYTPLVGTVVMKYRVDGGSWVTIFTESTAGVTVTEATVVASGAEFSAGRNYEFRIESTGSAEITGFHYKYENLETNL